MTGQSQQLPRGGYQVSFLVRSPLTSPELMAAFICEPRNVRVQIFTHKADVESSAAPLAALQFLRFVSVHPNCRHT